MILKTCFLFVLNVVWEVAGASFSNVFLQTGPKVAPAAEYLQYGAPTYAYEYPYDPKTAQLNVAPVGFEYPFAQPFGYRTPCAGIACFYPGLPIAPVAPVTPSTDGAAYAVPDKNGLNGYEYAYVVVNQNTGDQKAHSELSDGGVVRGQYSFLQPDGTVREVQYVADDSQGFNAIVKNFVPVDEVKVTEIIQQAPPCPEVKSAALTTHQEKLEKYEEPNALENQETNKKPEPNEENQEKNETQEIVIVLEENLEPQEKSAIITEELSKNEVKIEVEERTLENIEARSQPTHEKIVKIIQTEPQESQNVEVPASTHQHKDTVESNVYVSNNDIIKCIQAAMAKANTHPSALKPTSPLTYLILSKPC